MPETTIDYEGLAQEALRGVVRTVLTRVARTGLPDKHHFYIAFNTQADGVGLSKRLREQYPEEMTVVLQHRFWDLQVHDDRFEVKLTFNSIPERLVVPFKSIKVFFDPSIPYGLQFEGSAAGAESARRQPQLAQIVQSADQNVAPEPAAKAPPAPKRPKPASVPSTRPQRPTPAADAPVKLVAADDKRPSAEVVSLDQFRKK